VPVYATAREFLERALAAADAKHDRTEARLIALRICEVIEMEDFDECRRLDQPSAVIDSDRCAD
jgi:hypothetical protein